MAPTILSNLSLFLAALSLSPSLVQASWRMVAHTSVTARVDPLINPGKISGHVHDYVGGSNFGVTYDYNDMRASQCSSVEVQEDKSGYWAPAAYYKTRDGQFKLLKSSYMVYYLHRGSNQKAFPQGFTMIAGSAVKSSSDPNDPASAAINFHCLGPDTETLQFPDQKCDAGVRIQILFPSCWNGQTSSANFKDHMAYPTDGKEGNNCPDSHPTRTMTVFYEHIIYMDDVTDWYPGCIVLSEGDNVGYSSHADFAMGWDPEVLQRAIDECTDPYANLDNCGYLQPFRNDNIARQCQPVKNMPLEDVGFYGPIQKLLGDNQVWGGGNAKVTTGSSNTPPLVAPYSVVANGWAEHGCIDEGDPYVNTMNGAKTSDPSMSPQMCVNYCDGKGFSLAGLESAGPQRLHVIGRLGKCLDRCSGSYYEWCGGGRNLRVWQKTGNAAADSVYGYPPAGARLDRVYTDNGSSVPVTTPPTYGGSGSSTSSSGTGSTASDPSYGPNNPPKCSRNSKRKRNLAQMSRRQLEGEAFMAKRALLRHHARGHHH